MPPVKKMIVVSNKKGYGLVSEQGEPILNCTYASIKQFKNDTYAIKKHNTYKLYDSQLNLLHPKKFYDISLAVDGQYLVQIKGKNLRKVYGLLSDQGSWIIEPEHYRLNIIQYSGPVWYIAEDFHGNIKAFNNTNQVIRKWTNRQIIDYLGEGYFLETQFFYYKTTDTDLIFEKCDVIPGIITKATYFLTDLQNNTIEIDYKDNLIKPVKDGIFISPILFGFVLYDKHMKKIYPNPLMKADHGTDGFLAIKESDDSQEYYINGNGERQFNRYFTTCKAFLDGFAWVEEVDGWKGIISTTGEHICPCKYPIIESFIHDYTIAALPGNTFQVLDKTGNILQELSGNYINLIRYNCLYDQPDIFKPGQLMQLSGNILLTPSYLDDLNAGKYGFCFSCEKETFVVNNKGELVLQFNN